MGITILMIKMMMIIIINNDHNGDQKTTIFQTMHFREHVISAKPKFLALTHVLVYGYWCCQVTILSAYNASVMFLLRYYQSIAML